MLANAARVAGTVLLVVLLAACGKDNAQSVSKISVDWTGNDIAIDAVEDPDVKGVVCHVAYFNRSLIDRLQQGNWFEDPSYSALDCAASGPVTIGKIAMDRVEAKLRTLRSELDSGLERALGTDFPS